jgi:hypothetical protein
MNNALKGTLLSGLIFPGLGHVVFKHYKSGAAILLTVLIGLSLIVVKAVRLALEMLAEIEAGGGRIDMVSIMDAATKASTGSGTVTFNVLFGLVVGTWVVGMVDAYRIGRKMDLEDNPPPAAAASTDG